MPRPRSIELPHDLIAAYSRGEVSAAGIAQRQGISRHTVQARLREAGVARTKAEACALSSRRRARNRKRDAAIRREASKLRATGRPLTALAEKHGISKQRLHVIIDDGFP